MIENFLGGLSLSATAVNDFISGSSNISDGALIIGKDTLVAAKNTIWGFVPEVHADLAVSKAQLDYDMSRLYGEEANGSYRVELDGIGNTLKQLGIFLTTYPWSYP